MKIDLTGVYKRYKGLWVVLDEKLKKVVSYNKNAEKAYKEALPILTLPNCKWAIFYQ